jgi:hypothetical protein
MTWYSAKATCASQGLALASLDSSALCADVNSKVLAVAGASNYWIGANDIAQEGSWKWADGSPLTYSRWTGGEPSNSGSIEHCGHVYMGSGGWNDDNCSTRIWSFICGCKCHRSCLLSDAAHLPDHIKRQMLHAMS